VGDDSFNNWRNVERHSSLHKLHLPDAATTLRLKFAMSLLLLPASVTVISSGDLSPRRALEKWTLDMIPKRATPFKTGHQSTASAKDLSASQARARVKALKRSQMGR
jgi:hypothetical protein